MAINTFKLVSTSIMLTALAACGGGGGGGGDGGDAKEIDAVANQTGTSGFSVAPDGPSDCTPPPGTTEEAFQIVGNYKVYAGDCVASLTVDSNQWNTLLASSDNLDQVAIAADFRRAFKDSFDFLVILLDSGTDSPPPGWKYYGRYASFGVRTPVRTQTMMGSLVLPYLTAWTGTSIDGGPSLHELAHEWIGSGQMPIPTSQPDHLGFSSAGGQLGGWGYLTQEGANTYRGYGPDSCFSAEDAATALTQEMACSGPMRSFGTFANGGNSVKYSKLERFAMGLLPAGELGETTIAVNPVWLDPGLGVFSVTGLQYISEAQVVANMGRKYIPFDKSQKNFRIATLVITPSLSLDANKVVLIDQSLSDFSADGYPTRYVTDYGQGGVNTGRIAHLNNFYTATDGVAKMRAHGLFAERL